MCSMEGENRLEHRLHKTEVVFHVLNKLVAPRYDLDVVVGHSESKDPGFTFRRKHRHCIAPLAR